MYSRDVKIAFAKLRAHLQARLDNEVLKASGENAGDLERELQEKFQKVIDEDIPKLQEAVEKRDFENVITFMLRMEDIFSDGRAPYNSEYIALMLTATLGELNMGGQSIFNSRRLILPLTEPQEVKTSELTKEDKEFFMSAFKRLFSSHVPFDACKKPLDVYFRDFQEEVPLEVLIEEIKQVFALMCVNEDVRTINEIRSYIAGLISRNIVINALDRNITTRERQIENSDAEHYYTPQNLNKCIEQVYTIQEIMPTFFMESAAFSPFSSFFKRNNNAEENFKAFMQNQTMQNILYTPGHIELFTFGTMLKMLPLKEQLGFLLEYIKDERFKGRGSSSLNYMNYLNEHKQLLEEHVEDIGPIINELTTQVYSNIANSNTTVVMVVRRIFNKRNSASSVNLESAFLKEEQEFLKITEEDLVVGSYSSLNPEELTAEEKTQIKESKCVSLAKKYLEYGFINDETYELAFKIAQKYCKKLTKETFKEKVKSDKNLRIVLENITALCCEEGGPTRRAYLSALEDFECVFKKVRLQEFPDVTIYNKFSKEMLAKFNLEVYKEFYALPIFAFNEETKQALVEFIAIMGLFENDAQAQARRKRAKDLILEDECLLSVRELPFVYHKIEDEFSTEIHRIQQEENLDPTDIISQRYLEECKLVKYRLKRGYSLPAEFKEIMGIGYISEKGYARLKKMGGSFGKRVTDFLSPYTKIGEKYVLKEGVEIPEELTGKLKAELSEEEYNSLLKNDEIGVFLQPYERIVETGSRPNSKLSKADQTKVKCACFSRKSSGLCPGALHRMFDGLQQGFSQGFYELLIKNWNEILENTQLQGKLPALQSYYQNAIVYFKERGNTNPTIHDILTYIKTAPFAFEFGYYEFAQEAKNAGVPNQKRYDKYQELYKKLQNRKLSTIPRHNKTYAFTDEKGQTHTVVAKILRLDDPLTMLVGERNFTNCCQVYGNAGQDCMEHASTSQDGGILAIYVLGKDKHPQMLTQSWVWTRETKLCLDNVEGTQLADSAIGKKLVRFAISRFAEDVIQTSTRQVDEYIKKKAEKIKRDSKLTEAQKMEELTDLRILRERQTIKSVTVGAAYDDAGLREDFKERESDANSEGPKGYYGYRDSTAGQQLIVKKVDEPAWEVDGQYEDVAIYRDERRVVQESGLEIKLFTLKKLTEIEADAQRQEMRNYTQGGEPVLTRVSALADIYLTSVDNLNVIYGEDWYLVYSDNGEEIEILDVARTEPRLKDEASIQQQELMNAFNLILEKSVEIKNGKVENVKKISGKFREDTAYLLYLTMLKRGKLQQHSDELYSYNREGLTRPFTEEEQKQMLLSIMQVANGGNPNLNMHEVSFVPSEATIRKILDQRTLNSKGAQQNNEE